MSCPRWLARCSVCTAPGSAWSMVATRCRINRWSMLITPHFPLYFLKTALCGMLFMGSPGMAKTCGLVSFTLHSARQSSMRRRASLISFQTRTAFTRCRLPGVSTRKLLAACSFCLGVILAKIGPVSCFREPCTATKRHKAYDGFIYGLFSHFPLTIPGKWSKFGNISAKWWPNSTNFCGHWFMREKPEFKNLMLCRYSTFNQHKAVWEDCILGLFKK